MQTINIILSGLGGQGILFMTKILARTALLKGIDALGAETHGMAQRGGSVVSHLKLGQAQSSLINNGSAHFLLALEESEAYRNLSFLGAGGKIFVNADSSTFPRAEISPYLKKNKIECHAAQAGKIALKLGAPRSANLALIGFMTAFEESPFTPEEILKTIDQISPGPFKEANFKIFNAGTAARGSGL